eukprot:CAMPEP_0194076794 /NCGR_PEP_ID=MMETSP0149-20130528/3553_1 /TAXON_ID=122233 /ORGANISM="Chaetoceros debilis, Strain MM31A-1" /LENGTH=107 /DNA_ID=CAMNT_0038757653 /DNA_START=210 /DNA_END=533 /DNA_ORIENTATION=+
MVKSNADIFSERSDIIDLALLSENSLNLEPPISCKLCRLRKPGKLWTLFIQVETEDLLEEMDISISPDDDDRSPVDKPDMSLDIPRDGPVGAVGIVPGPDSVEPDET